MQRSYSSGLEDVSTDSTDSRSRDVPDIKLSKKDSLFDNSPTHNKLCENLEIIPEE